MVANEKADRQHAIACDCLGTAKYLGEKVDYYNLGVHMANV